MATDIKIDRTTRDIVVEDGLLQLVEDSEAAAQRIWSRLHTFRGEWFLDLRHGVPYRADIFVKSPQMPVVSAALAAEILAGAGTGSQLTRLDLMLDNQSRQLNVDGDVTLPQGGEQVTVSQVIG